MAFALMEFSNLFNKGNLLKICPLRLVLCKSNWRLEWRKNEKSYRYIAIINLVTLKKAEKNEH
jgi:hypothetical protein